MALYIKYLKIHIKSQLQYPASFILMCLGQFISAFTGFAGIWFLFDRFHSVEGFTLQEVLLCFAIVSMAFALAECFFRGFDRFSVLLGNGQFDRMLVRPAGAVFQVLAAEMEFSRIGKLLQSVAVFIYALVTVEVSWSWDKILTLVFMLVGGVVVFSALFLVYAALCFFTTEGLEVMNILTYGGKEFGNYPYAVYGKGVLRFLTYVIPLALFQYYPLLYLTGMSNRVWYMLLPLAGCLFVFPSYGLWRLGLRHYKSTGS